ncbi:IclR family transcriptional regulator [Streptomyces chiangmaiensis]|uniref:IclR family transcriptional regulator C-terminal domain-containing protein n=1 Tax=Streptomyces chiangmaiensis TaxID=766497 RepID=A0ABU7FE02_9ACTN|nr:IclR family transcriptional regulator C-terminal domain-containing protein [Streptomyces chiangmaiensis]MED7822381.1 IclR family transcriptional regulator C-terminal domain-containing protein [Streptomyces chiangmaiensis]
MATVGTARADSPAPPVQRCASPAEERLPPVQPQSTLIGSVQRAMRLLEAVADREYGAPAKQLAREVGLALPTAYHLLRTLTHEGFLRREKGLFFLGDAAERLSSGAAQQKRRSMVDDALAQWRDSIGVPVYYAVYREGEIDVLSVADSPSHPAVAEWADFRETGHAHAIGRCLLSQLDEEARRDHLDRYPVRSITPYTVRDEHTFLRRLERLGRMEPVFERQEYALGTVCAAVPITAGATAATVAISMPAHQADRLQSAAYQLQREVGRLVGTLALSINI